MFLASLHGQLLLISKWSGYETKDPRGDCRGMHDDSCCTPACSRGELSLDSKLCSYSTVTLRIKMDLILLSLN